MQIDAESCPLEYRSAIFNLKDNCETILEPPAQRLNNELN